MSELHWAELINNILMPVIAIVVVAFLIPYLRAKAKSTGNKGYDTLADILATATSVAKNSVVQVEANADNGAAGVDKKQVAIKQTAEQLQKLGVDTSKLDLTPIVESAYSAKKSELHANYVKSGYGNLPKPL